MIEIAFDETHHLKNGKPLYKTRYTKVMSFHNGIAPVENKQEAFFINIENIKMFEKNFQQAFGFYENISAVKDSKGWFHIDIKGDEIYSERYEWVGNFGESVCVVKNTQGYFHINQIGKPLYSGYFSYTGDFKYGIAVAIGKDGKATHINKMGKPIHNHFFEELDIFHKGFAIANDGSGYFHINKQGDELYSERYKKLEPFYNSKAFATTFQGEKITLEENSFKVNNLAYFSQTDNILKDTFSYFKHQILSAILKLGFLEKTNIDLPDISHKLITKWLENEGILKEENLTKLGKEIVNLKEIIIYWQTLPFQNSVTMVESLKKGDETFSQTFGKPYFDYLENNFIENKISQNVMSFYSFDYFKLIENMKLTDEVTIDIGGGNGSLLKNIQDMYPNIKPLTYDKFSDQNRLKIDFFNPFNVQADIFILSRVLHDWSDLKAEIILNNIKNSMNKNSVLYLFETIQTKNLGLTLSFHLMNFVGGRERTLTEFQELLNRVGLKIINITSGDPISLLKVKK